MTTKQMIFELSNKLGYSVRTTKTPGYWLIDGHLIDETEAVDYLKQKALEALPGWDEFLNQQGI